MWLFGPGGLLEPDEGAVTADGATVLPNPTTAKAHLGKVTDNLGLFDRLSGQEMLEYPGLLGRVDRGVIRQRTEELLRVAGPGEPPRLVWRSSG